MFASVIRGLTASESLETLRKMGAGVEVYFVITTATISRSADRIA